MKRKRIMDELMDEVILYGGLPVQRADAYDDAFERTGSHKAADMFAFGLQTKLASAGYEPLTRIELEALP